MWFLVQVAKGNKYFEPDSQVGNRVLISDTSDMVIAGRSMGADGYRFEMRKGNECFIVRDFPGTQVAGSVSAKFTSLAQQIEALSITKDTPAAPAASVVAKATAAASGTPAAGPAPIANKV